MKVLLINPRFAAASQPPLGLAYVSAYLKRVAGITDVAIIDTAWQDLKVEMAKLTDIDVVGLYVMTPYFSRAKETVAAVRRRFPRAVFVAGGPHVNAVPPHSIRLGIDYGVSGEGEIAFSELAKALANGREPANIGGVFRPRQGGSIEFLAPTTPIENLDDLPFPDRAALPMAAYLKRGIMQEFGFRPLRATTILTSRGCPFKCLFCNRALGHRARYRSHENVIEEIKELVERYQIEGLFIVDDTFTLKRRWMIEFCRRLSEANLGLALAVNSRVDTVNPEMLAAMREAGVVSIAYGIESGNQEILDRLQKGITVEQVETAVRYTKEAGIYIKGYFMIGIPGETHGNIVETVRLAKRLPFDQVQFSIAVPYPGTELSALARRQNLIESADHIFQQGFQAGGSLRTEMMLAREIKRFYNLRCRPLVYRKIINHVIRDPRSWPHFLQYLRSRAERRSSEWRRRLDASRQPTPGETLQPGDQDA